MVDSRNILPGHNGQLLDDSGNMLAAVPTFHATLNVTNSEYHPAGTLQSVKVLTGYSVTLTLTETVISDATLLQSLFNMLSTGEQMQVNFQGYIKGRNGNEERMIFTECVPDGAIDLQNVQPGDIISRAWNFAVNQPPTLQKLLS